MLQHSFDFSTGIATNLDLLTSPGHLLLSRGAPATFSRNSPATKKDGSSVLAGVPRYEAGIFGTAAMVEEGTTNLVPLAKQKFEGWSAYLGSVVTLTQNQSVPEWNATDATRVQTSGGTGTLKFYIDLTSTPSVNGQAYSISVYLKNIGSAPVVVGANLETSKNVTVNAGEQKKVAISVTGNGSAYLMFRIQSANIADSLDFIAWRPQAEAKAYATSWTDSARSPELLALPATGLTPTQGTIELMVYVDAMARRQVSGQYNVVFRIPRLTGAGGLSVWHSPAVAAWKLETYDDAGQVTATVNIDDTLTPDGWHRFAVTWTAQAVKLFFDGTLRAILSNPKLPSAFGELMTIGSSPTGSYLNTLFDDVRLSSVARSDAELASWNTILPVDAYTIAKYRMDSDLFPDYVNGGNWVGVFDTTKAIAAWRQLAISTLNTAGVHYSARSSFDGVTWGEYHHDSLPERGRYIELTIGLSALNGGDTSPDVTGAVLDWVGPASRDPLIRAKEATYSVRAKIPGYDN